MKMARFGTCTFILGALLMGHACAEDESSPEPGGPPIGGAPSAADASVESPDDFDATGGGSEADASWGSDASWESDAWVQERVCDEDWCKDVVYEALQHMYEECKYDTATFNDEVVKLADTACAEARVGCAECGGRIARWDCQQSEAIVTALYEGVANDCLGF
jgi:hypothetical protein